MSCYWVICISPYWLVEVKKVNLFWTRFKLTGLSMLFSALICRNLNLKHAALGKIYPFLFLQPSLFHPSLSQVHFIKISQHIAGKEHKWNLWFPQTDLEIGQTPLELWEYKQHYNQTAYRPHNDSVSSAYAKSVIFPEVNTADESSTYISMMKQITELNLQSGCCIILHILPLSDLYLAETVLIIYFHRDCEFSRYAYNFANADESFSCLSYPSIHYL